MPLHTVLDIAPIALSYWQPTVLDLLAACAQYGKTVPLIFVKWEKQISGKFLFRIKATDGRLWKQTIELIPGDSKQSFEFTDIWKLSEYAPQKDIRDLLILLSGSVALTTFSLTFTQS